MNVTQDLEIWSLIASASLVVKFVMALLLGVSFMSWLFIFRKMIVWIAVTFQPKNFLRWMLLGKASARC